LVATALLGIVLSKEDSSSAFIGAFHAAAFVGATSAVVAGIFAITLIRPTRTDRR
jgi:hypothetical protein